MTRTEEQTDALVNYVRLHFEHEKAKDNLRAASDIQHLLRIESQEAWRTLKKVDLPPGAHLVQYKGLQYAVEFGAGDFLIPLPVIE